MIKAVLDTNVIISAFILDHGNPRKVLNSSKEKDFISVTSDEIIEEVVRILLYNKFKKYIEADVLDIQEAEAYLRECCLSANPSKKFDLVKDDPTDNKFLDCAYAASADFIVTGDSHLLKLGDFFDTKIITPKKFLDFVTHNS